MKLRHLWLHVAAMISCATGTPAQDDAKSVAVGSNVPDLSCLDLDGNKLSWGRWKGRAVVLFFHSEDMRFSRKGLESVLAALNGEKELRARAALLLVTTGIDDLATLKDAIAGVGVPVSVVVDPDRSHFSGYHVVAFPTVFCVDRDRRVVHIAKGFGPLLSTRVVAGTKLAAGMIDRAAFEKAVSAAPAPVQSAQVIRVARTVRMAKQLLAAGMLDEARESLLRVLPPDSDHAEGVSLLATILLRQGRSSDAEKWVDRYAQLAPKSIELRQLRAELALAGGDVTAVRQLLEGLDTTEPRVAWLLGRACEREENFEEAAKLYRRVVEAWLENPR